MAANGNLDAKQLKEFNKALGYMDENQLSSFVAGMSTQQMSSTSLETLSAVGGSSNLATQTAALSSELSSGGFGATETDATRRSIMAQMSQNYQAARTAGNTELQQAIIGAAMMCKNNPSAFNDIMNDTNGTFTGKMSGQVKYALGLSDTLPPPRQGTTANNGPTPNPDPFGPPLPPPPGPGGNPPFGPGGGPRP